MIASFVGTLSGFGVGTLMTPLVLLFIPFPQTIFLICIIHWFHDLWKIIFFHYGIDWKLLVMFGIPTIVGSFFGALFVGFQPELLSGLLGAFLVGYVIFLYFKPTFSIPSTTASAIIGGVVSGFFAGIFGVRGAVRGAFLTSYDLQKATYLGTIAIISLLTDTTRFITYWLEGIRLSSDLIWGLLLFIPASFVGVWIGQKVINVIPQEKFRAFIAIFFLLAGLWFLGSSFIYFLG
jgi:uncharacterized membrane protein YfcA